MNKFLCIIYILFSTQVFAGKLQYKNISLIAPDNWEINGSVIYSSDKKIGEITSKRTWHYKSGSDFIQSFKQGFVDDPETTKFISSGESEGVVWICRFSEYEGSSGEFGTWYVRRFWFKGPILTLYSRTGCDSKLKQGIRIALTMSEEEETNKKALDAQDE